jgi:hypothetical protein
MPRFLPWPSRLHPLQRAERVGGSRHRAPRQKTLRDGRKQGDGNAVDSTAPAHSDTFDYVSIDEKNAAIQSVKTDIAWTSTRVPPDYRMPPAGECSI